MNAEQRLTDLLSLYDIHALSMRQNKALDYYVTAKLRTPSGTVIDLIADYSDNVERYVASPINKGYSHIGDVLRDLGLVKDNN